MKHYLLTILALLSACFSYAADSTSGTKSGPITSDKDFFEAIDLDLQGLESVKTAVLKADYDAAKHNFVTYLKNRKEPEFFFDWKDFYKPETRGKKFHKKEADKYANNLLVSCSIWHQFGKGEDIDWSINPTELKYKEWTWQLSRMQYWKTLGEAYWSTGDERYAEAFANQVRSWIKRNPVPSKKSNGAGSRWRTIESGIRSAQTWPYAFYYFLPSQAFDDETIIMMVKSFYEHALYLRKFQQRNNWLTMEMNGLFHIGLLFPEFKQAAEWCKFASDKLYNEEKIQFYPDGAQVELATGYHYVSVHNILGIYKIAKLNNYSLPDGYEQGLMNAYEYAQKIATPNDRLPALNDSGWGSTLRELKAASDLFPERQDFKYWATNGKEGSLPAYTSTWMPYAGWYIMRSSWEKDANYCLFEVGPWGGGHQHEDKLSFVLYSNGHLAITEGGTYAYDSSDWRKYVLSARAHNTVKVDGEDQYRRTYAKDSLVKYSKKPLENRFITNDSFDFGEGWYNEGFGTDNDKTVTHYRAITFVKNKYWLLVDAFTPADDKVHVYDSRFHFDSPEFSEDKKTNSVRSGYEDAPNVSITRLSTAGLKEKGLNVACGQKEPVVEGWVPTHGAKKYQCRPVATPTFHAAAAGNLVQAYLICPIEKGNEDIPVKSIKESVGKDGSCNYEIRMKDGSKESISLIFDGNSIQYLTVNGKEIL